MLQAPPGPPAASVPPVGPETSPAPVASESSLQGNQKSANKYITLSVILPAGSTPAKPGSNKPVLNLLDIVNLNANQRAEDTEAGGADMDPVDKALQQAILKAWIAPEIASVPPSQRRATMELAILRDGAIEDASITVPSGSSLLDTSIRQATQRLKKIPVSLPSNFPKERYELRVNFQIE
jgi:outer membrane biosynthesis protein TonB